MKKKILILIFLFIGSILLPQTFKFDLDTTYNSNILNLSDSDIDRFNAGNDPDKFQIDTIDDLIISPKIQFNYKHKILFGHTQIDKISINYDKYLINSCKDNFFLEVAVKQFINRKLNIGIHYYYYPEIFVNRYDSVFDDEDVYRDFTYSKNKYLGILNYKILQTLNFKYKLAATQSFYNEYFTENDALAIDNILAFQYSFFDILSLGIEYGYIVSKADAEKAFSQPNDVTIAKDASYKSNQYGISTKSNSMIFLRKGYNFNLDFKYERKYFQSLNEFDNYHYGRIDNKYMINTSLDYKILPTSTLRVYYKYEARNSKSPFEEVITSKTYDLYKIGIKIYFSIDIIN